MPTLAVTDVRMPKAIEIQKADSRARRRAALVLAAGMVVGALLILGLGHYRDALQEWLVSASEPRADRIKLALGVLAILMAVPLYGVAVYLWRVGGAVTGAQRFPPPGCAVVRDTPVLVGPGALRRGRTFRAFAVVLVVAATVMAAAFWRVAIALPGQGA